MAMWLSLIRTASSSPKRWLAPPPAWRARHVLDDQKQQDIEAKVAATIDEALEFAMNSPDPKPEDAVTDLYA